MSLALAQSALPAVSSAVQTASAASVIQACLAREADKQCEGTWRGHAYQLDDHSGQITTGGGEKSDGHWSWHCKTDRMEDYRTCTLQRQGLTIIAINGRVQTFSWGGSKFPGSEKQARIGRGSALTWLESETISRQEALALVKSMCENKEALFRWYDWPHEDSHDVEVDLTGFSDAFEMYVGAITEYEKQ